MTAINRLLYTIIIGSLIAFGSGAGLAVGKGITGKPSYEKTNNRKVKDSVLIVEPATTLPVPTELEILDAVAPTSFEIGIPIRLTYAQGQSVYAVVDGAAGPITFSFMGISHTENSAPFHMNGDNNYVSFPAGTHAIGIQTPDYNYSVFIDVDQALVVEEAAAEEPIVDEPIVDEPVVDEPVVDEPVVDEPVVDESVVDEPAVDEPVVDESVVDEPAVDEPVVDEPVVDEPVVDEPVVDEPVVVGPLIELVNSIPIPTALEILDGTGPLIFEGSTPISLTFTQGQSIFVVVDADIGPITFSFMGISHTENSRPFHMNGDNNYVSFPAGIHEIDIQTPNYNYSVFIDVAVEVEEPVVDDPSVEESVSAEPVVDEPLLEEPEAQEDAPYSVKPGEFNLYPRETNGWDESGWSIITPSEDSRLIYVSSSSGNDDTAEFYAPRDIDSLEYPGSIKPFKTIEAAHLNTRQGYPDWILLRRGDVWEVSGAIHLKGGRSADERSILFSYGENTERPVLTNSGTKDILRIWSEIRFVAIVGISFYGIERDPSAQEFVGWGNVGELRGIFIYSGDAHEDRMGSILIEDNRFNFLSKAISSTGDAEHVDIVIRRNVIRNSYSETGHSQGMSAAYTSALVEENIFDHNGWLTQQDVKNGKETVKGQATMFNHNTYFSSSMDTVFKNNIFLRPSSIHNKWTANPPADLDEIMSRNLIMEDNLYVGGEIGVSAGGNDDNNNGNRWENVEIIDNVLMAIGRDQPTKRTLGWNIDATDWNGGLICGNYLLHTDNPAVNNIYGIKVSGHSNDVTVTRNTIHGLITPNPSSINGAISIVDADPKSNIVVSMNNIQLQDSSLRVVIAEQLDSIVFEDNKYFSYLVDTDWFRAEGVNQNISVWRTLSGDISSTVEQDSFLQPKRTFETYLSSIGSLSINAFVDAADHQSYRVWGEEFSAKKINNYIREGYGNTTCN